MIKKAFCSIKFIITGLMLLAMDGAFGFLDLSDFQCKSDFQICEITAYNSYFVNSGTRISTIKTQVDLCKSIHENDPVEMTACIMEALTDGISDVYDEYKDYLDALKECKNTYDGCMADDESSSQSIGGHFPSESRPGSLVFDTYGCSRAMTSKHRTEAKLVQSNVLLRTQHTDRDRLQSNHSLPPAPVSATWV